MKTGVSLNFSGHNIALPDGSETLPGTPLIADDGITRAALRDLKLAFSTVPPEMVQVADLGCLEGGHAAAFARAGYAAYGYEARTENYLCCKYVAEQLALPNLRFFKVDVREAIAVREWDAAFCCGLLYHLDNPVAFLNELGKSTRRLLILQTHYSTRPDAEHEGRRGHWYTEVGQNRWAAWQNKRSFWLTKKDLMAAIHDAGFQLVFEQVDYLDDITAEGVTHPDARGMFVGIKV